MEIYKMVLRTGHTCRVNIVYKNTQCKILSIPRPIDSRDIVGQNYDLP